MNVIVGLSGGVDSSVAALLLKKAGYDVTGVTMAIWSKGKYEAGARGGCFSPDKENDMRAAEAFCRQIGIAYRAFDCSREYEDIVLAYFRDEYLAGRTPNPCVHCNSIMKFGLLPDKAETEGIAFDSFATGHYARIQEIDGRHCLLRAADTHKDQSYFLYRLSQAQLARQLFPLGGLHKDEVRKIALDNNLVSANKPDSQDFYDGDRNDILHRDAQPGHIVDARGRVLGHHNGYWNFTIGQRKGLCVAAREALYVIELNACRNEVVVGPVNETVRHSLVADDCNWIALENLDKETDVQIKVRSAGQPVPGARIAPLENGRVEAHFPAGISGIAPGQSAVFYDGDVVLGGGIIRETA